MNEEALLNHSPVYVQRDEKRPLKLEPPKEKSQTILGALRELLHVCPRSQTVEDEHRCPRPLKCHILMLANSFSLP